MNRKYYIDWLRIFAVAMLVPFHTARIFDVNEFHINNDVNSIVLTAITQFISIWHMPLLFLLSGAATCFALNYRSSKQYSKERFLRLIVPLVFGILIIIPPQIYLERIQKLQFFGSYFEFFPKYFNGIYPS